MALSAFKKLLERVSAGDEVLRERQRAELRQRFAPPPQPQYPPTGFEPDELTARWSPSPESWMAGRQQRFAEANKPPRSLNVVRERLGQLPGAFGEALAAPFEAWGALQTTPFRPQPKNADIFSWLPSGNQSEPSPQVQAYREWTPPPSIAPKTVFNPKEQQEITKVLQKFRSGELPPEQFAEYLNSKMEQSPIGTKFLAENITPFEWALLAKFGVSGLRQALKGAKAAGREIAPVARELATSEVGAIGKVPKEVPKPEAVKQAPQPGQAELAKVPEAKEPWMMTRAEWNTGEWTPSEFVTRKYLERVRVANYIDPEARINKRIEFINLDKLNPIEERASAAERIEGIKAALRENPDSVPPIIVQYGDKDMYDIVDGNTRYLAAKANGLKKVPVILVQYGDETYVPHHQDIVEKALSEGKLVPAEVLKDYPDLAKQAPSPEVPKPVVKPSVRLKEISARVSKLTSELTSEKTGRPTKATLARREKARQELDALYKEADDIQSELKAEKKRKIAEGDAFDIAQEELIQKIENKVPVTEDELDNYLTTDSDWRKKAIIKSSKKGISVDDDVIWHSPYTDEDVVMNFRGYNGDNAVLYNKQSGMQISVPKNQIKLSETPSPEVPKPVVSETITLKAETKALIPETPTAQAAKPPVPPKPPAKLVATAMKGRPPKEVAFEQVKAWRNELIEEAKKVKASLKGLKGTEAKSMRLMADTLDKEMTNFDSIIKAAEKGIATSPDIKAKRQSIMLTARLKGFTEPRLRKMFTEITGVKSLWEMTPAQLNRAHEAVIKARPDKIGNKHVITATTEKAIQSLKQTLISQGKMTEEGAESLRRQLHLYTDKYHNAKLFISEKEGKELIRRINQSAEVGLYEWDSKVAQGLKNKPNIAEALNKIDARLDEGILQDKPAGVSGWLDMTYYTQRLQERTGKRFNDVYERIIDTHKRNQDLIASMDKELQAVTPDFKKIARDQQALEHIRLYIASKRKILNIDPPKDITPAEIKVAEQIEKDLFMRQNDVRYYRFKKAYDQFEGNSDLMRTELRNAPKGDLRKAVDIYESQGSEELRKYLDTKDWGVIKSGYEPEDIISGLKLHNVKSSTVGKGHLTVKEGLELHPQDRNILQRRSSYLKQVTNLNMESYFKELDRIYLEAIPDLKNAGRINKDLSLFINEAKGYPVTERMAQIGQRIGGYAFSVLSLAPRLVYRNTLQNFMHPDLITFIPNLLKGKLSAERMKWFHKVISEDEVISREWLMQEGMGNTPLENFVKKVSYFGKGETYVNRLPSIQASINKADSALKTYQRTGKVQDFIKGSGMLELETLEQKHILELLAQDKIKPVIEGLEEISGSEAAVREIARRITEKVHFRYARYERAPGEQGISGRTIGSLFTYPRGIIQRIVNDVRKIKNGTPAEKIRASKSISTLLVGMVASDYIWQLTTGRDDKPYNPLNSFTWTPGGLAIGAPVAISDIIRSAIDVVMGQEGAPDRLIQNATRGADMFVPFYKPLMDLLEAATDTKNLDRKTLRRIRDALDPQYKINEKAYEQQRNWIEIIQKSLFGVDKEQPKPASIPSYTPQQVPTEESKPKKKSKLLRFSEGFKIPGKYDFSKYALVK